MTDDRSMRLSGHSRVFRLTPEAHKRILDYLQTARDRLRGDPDADETLRDLEVALGDRLSAATDSPDRQLDGERAAAALDALGAVEPGVGRIPSDAQPRGPFWCRILEGRWFAGICGGIAARGGHDLGWVRTIAILLMLVSGGLIGIAYLVLALVLPPVATADEYRRLIALPRSSDARRGGLRTRLGLHR